MALLTGMPVAYLGVSRLRPRERPTEWSVCIEFGFFQIAVKKGLGNRFWTLITACMHRHGKN